MLFCYFHVNPQIKYFIISFNYHLNALIQLFYPKVCYACNIHQIENDDEVICMECLQNLPYTKFELIKENATEKLFWGRVPTLFACSIFYFEKENMIQNIIHQIKYNDEKKLGVFMGMLIGLRIKEVVQQHKIDFMIPMPLHPKKIKKRGYNQASLLCEGIRSICKVEFYENAISRIQHTQTQTKKSRIKGFTLIE